MPRKRLRIAHIRPAGLKPEAPQGPSWAVAEVQKGFLEALVRG